MKPILVEIGSGLNVMDTRAMSCARVQEFTGVVAIRSTDDDDHVTLLRQIYRGVLSLFGRLANRIYEAHF